MTERHGGTRPVHRGRAVALPGVGTYTAAAVATFAFGERTDRRRHQRAPSPRPGRRRRGACRAVTDPGRAHRRGGAGARRADEARRWSVAVMELGALVCTARAPRCADCPVADLCAWQCGRPPGIRRARPAGAGLARHRPPAAGALLAVLRGSPAPVPRTALEAVSDNAAPARALPRLPRRRRAGRATGPRPLPAARPARGELTTTHPAGPRTAARRPARRDDRQPGRPWPTHCA